MASHGTCSAGVMVHYAVPKVLCPSLMQGDLGSRRAKYEARWHSFAANKASAPVRYQDIPWLIEEPQASKNEIRAFVLYGAASAADEKKRLRLELMRWHPDKWVARFADRLVPADKERVLQQVNATSQKLTALSSQGS